jgi:hypothetical protein
MEYMKSSGGESAVPHNPESPMFSSPYFWLVLAAIAVAIFQTWVRYSRDWFDPKLALHYQDIFEGKTLCRARAAAAWQFKQTGKYNAETKEVEVVLDIFEDIGFYVKHDEISAEVAHHHFYYWIAGYVQTASSYIDNYRRDEPTTYEHCKYLLEQTTAVESKKLKVHPSTLTLDEEDVASFIEEETGMVNLTEKE